MGTVNTRAAHGCLCQPNTLPSARRNLPHPWGTQPQKLWCRLWLETMGVFCLPATHRNKLTLRQPSQMSWASSETTFQILVQVWCFPTPISAVIYLTTFKVTQNQEWGKGIPLVPGHFRRDPSPTSSHPWLKHYSHMTQITEPPQRTMPQAGMVQVLSEKAILLWHDLCQASYHPPQCFLPHQMPPPVQQPTCWQGCSMSQIKELTLISIATQEIFPQTSAFVILSFLCTRHEAGLKAQGLYNSAAW